MPREYPPKPKIGYGAFDSIGRPLLRGDDVAEYLIGYGILNPPEGFYGIVRPSMDHRDLLIYLDESITEWEKEVRSIDFENVENKWELIVDLPIDDFQIVYDNVAMRVGFPNEIDPNQRWHSLVFCFSPAQRLPGLEMIEAMRLGPDGEYARIVKVEGDELTTNRGLTFTVRGGCPIMTPSLHTRDFLMRNLDMQRAARDSAPAVA